MATELGIWLYIEAQKLEQLLVRCLFKKKGASVSFIVPDILQVVYPHATP